MEESKVVDLDALNPKQRLKEYKSTQKDFRSKDGEVKLRALRKLVDLRYLSEGSCLLPFLLSIQPKKKTIAFLAEALALFAQHLTAHFAPSPHPDNHASPSQQADLGLNAREILRASLLFIFESDRALAFLQGLLDALVYKDEVKPPKQKKLPKGAPPPPPPPPPEERPEVVQMRRSALQLLFYLTESLREEEAGQELGALQRAWAKLETITHRLQQLVPSLLPAAPTSEEEKERPPLSKDSLQDAIYLLRMLEFQMNYCPSNRASFAVATTVDSMLTTNQPPLCPPTPRSAPPLSLRSSSTPSITLFCESFACKLCSI